MDKYEFNIKVEQIKKLVGKSDFQTAMKIADTIDWRRVRNANLLSMIASVYEKNEEYQEAKDILLIAFDRAPVGKRLLYKLTQLAIKQGNVQEAESYYREFCELAGDDPRQYVLRYLILKAKGVAPDQLIHCLESYTSTELDEKWLYELAELYHQAGMKEKCVQTCDKIMLMFGLGQYVDKAMELKLLYAPLTKYQIDLVENRDKYEEKLRMVEQNGGSAVMPELQESFATAQTAGTAAAGYVDGQVMGGAAYAGGQVPGGVVYAGGQAAGEVSYAGGQVPGGVSYAGGQASGEDGHGEVNLQTEAAYYGNQASDGAAYGSVQAAGETVYPGNPMAGDAAAAYAGNLMAGGAVYAGNPMPDGAAYAGSQGQGNAPYGGSGALGGGAYGSGQTAGGTAAFSASSSGSQAVKRQTEVHVSQGTAGMQQAFAGMTEEAIPGRPRTEPRPIPVPPPSAQMYGGRIPAGENGSRPGFPEETAPRLSDTFVQETSQAVNMGVIDEEKLVANLREAEVEASLAEEMSKISMDAYSEEPVKARTRVLNDVKELKDAEALAGKTKVWKDVRHIPEQQAGIGAEISEMPVRRNEPNLPHMMVQARTSEIGVAIALDALKRAHLVLGYKHPVAKISGEKLNQKGVLASAAKLTGKDLIIEDAGDLTDAMLEELEQFLEENAGRTTVMLVDNSRQISGIRKASPSLAEKFREVVSLAEAESYLDELERTVKETINKHSQENEAGNQETVSPERRQENVRVIRQASVSPDENKTVRVEPAQQAGTRAARVVRMDSAQAARPESDIKTVRHSKYDAAKDDDQTVKESGAQTAPEQRLSVKKTSDQHYLESENSGQDIRDDGRKAAAESRGANADGEDVMGIDEFAQYCCQYASQIDCNITGKSMLALYERIEIMEADGIALTQTAAEDLIEEAADRAEKPSIGKRLTGLFSSKYDKEGLLILKEEHFI